MFTQILKKSNCAYFLIFCVAIQAINIYSDTIVVTSEENIGADTLRSAISNAGNNDIIVFASNVQLIKLLSPLPQITQSNLTIDGLAQVFNSEVIPGDCNAFPSPVDDQAFFSAALRVTIDGSNIPKDTPDRGIGFNIQSDNVTIIGLRIQNFNGQFTSGTESPQATGITAATLTDVDMLPTIQCCEIKNIISGTTTENPIETGIAFGIDTALLVNKCLIQNINSLSSFSTDTQKIGSCSGIESSQTITNSVVTKVERGSTSSSALISVGYAAGISLTKDSPSFSDILIQNCIIQAVSGGCIEIIHDETEPAQVEIDTVSGFFQNLNTLISTTVQHVTICAINGGSIGVPSSYNRINVEPVQALLSENDTTTVSDSCITTVEGYTITVSGDNNTLLYPHIIGINTESKTVILRNNTINAVCGNNIAMAGNDNSAYPQFLFPFAPCIPPIPFSVIGIRILTPPTYNNIIEHTTIQNIGTGQYIIEGAQSRFLGSGSAGINVTAALLAFTNVTKAVPDFTTLITGNTITSITGPTYQVQPDSLQTIQLNGTAGIYAESFITRISDNTIQNVTEGSMRTISNSPLTLYGLPLGVDNLTDSLPAATVPFLPVYTNGISVVGSSEPQGNIDMNGIIVKNNTLEDIQGSLVLGGTASFGSYAAGIIAQPSLDQVQSSILKQLPQCDNPIGFVNNNVINKVQAQSKTASYGIFIDGSNILIESALISLGTPFVISKLEVQENSISSILGAGTINSVYVTSTETTLLPFLPSEPTSGIFTLFGGCSALRENNIVNVHAPLTRGITTVASSDMTITRNTIFKTSGPGIFVGGASANPILINNSGIFDQQQFEQFFPSVRNTIYSNSTYANTGEGIELGVINWNNFFTSVPLLDCAPQDKSEIRKTTKGGPVELEIIGNHNQPTPHIAHVVCNRNGTITVEVKFSDPNHPDSKFIVQFFRNNTNDAPHGEQLISNFDDPRFIIMTNADGSVRKSFTFVPAAKVTSTDIISVHITLTVDGASGSIEESEDNGDTSKFRMEVTTSNNPASHLQKNSAPKQFCYG